MIHRRNTSSFRSEGDVFGIVQKQPFQQTVCQSNSGAEILILIQQSIELPTHPQILHYRNSRYLLFVSCCSDQTFSIDCEFSEIFPSQVVILYGPQARREAIHVFHNFLEGRVEVIEMICEVTI